MLGFLIGIIFSIFLLRSSYQKDEKNDEMNDLFSKLFFWMFSQTDEF